MADELTPEQRQELKELDELDAMEQQQAAPSDLDSFNDSILNSPRDQIVAAPAAPPQLPEPPPERPPYTAPPGIMQPGGGSDNPMDYGTQPGPDPDEPDVGLQKQFGQFAKGQFTPRQSGSYLDEHDVSGGLEKLGLGSVGRAIEGTPLDVSAGTLGRQLPRALGTYGLGALGFALAGPPGALVGGAAGNALFGSTADAITTEIDKSHAVQDAMGGNKGGRPDYAMPPEPMGVGELAVESVLAGLGPAMQAHLSGAYPSGVRTRLESQEQFSTTQMNRLAASARSNPKIAEEYIKKVASGGPDAVAAAIGVDDAAYRAFHDKPPSEAITNILKRQKYTTIKDLENGVRTILQSEKAGSGELSDSLSTTARSLDRKLDDSVAQVSQNTFKEVPRKVNLGDVYDAKGRKSESTTFNKVPVRRPVGIAADIIKMAEKAPSSGASHEKMIDAAHDLANRIMDVGGDTGHVGVEGMREILKMIREYRETGFGGDVDAGRAFAKLVANDGYAKARERLNGVLGHLADDRGTDVGRLASKFLRDNDYLHDVMSMKDFMAQAPKKESEALLEGRNLLIRDPGHKTFAGMSVDKLHRLGLADNVRSPQSTLNTTYGSMLMNNQLPVPTEGGGLARIGSLPEGLPLTPYDVADPSAMMTTKGMTHRGFNVGVDSFKAAFMSREAVARGMLKAGFLDAPQALSMMSSDNEEDFRKSLAAAADANPTLGDTLKREGIIIDPQVMTSLQDDRANYIIQNMTPSTTKAFREMQKISEGGTPR